MAACRQVIDYVADDSPEVVGRHKFLLQWADSGKEKWATRFNVLFDDEDESKFHKRIVAARQLRDSVEADGAWLTPPPYASRRLSREPPSAESRAAECHGAEGAARGPPSRRDGWCAGKYQLFAQHEIKANLTTRLSEASEARSRAPHPPAVQLPLARRLNHAPPLSLVTPRTPSLLHPSTPSRSLTSAPPAPLYPRTRKTHCQSRSLKMFV